ncbi:MAG: HAD-IIB family hydrolase [Caulobacteraceae bacterium]|nr:HAD-IIB family hydrolase [Caulobacteraceae bacterium]
MARDIRLLLADVDGTLVTSDKVLTPGAVAAARDLAAAGIALAITSGRPPRGMAMLIEPLGLTTPIAGFNGGVFVHPDMTVIESHSLGPQAAGAALRLILGQGLDAWIYTPGAWLVRDAGAPHVAREAWTVKFEPVVAASFDAPLADVVKIVGVSDDLERVARCEAAVREALGATASAARSQPYYLDVTHAEANKGAVVGSLSRRLGIPTAAIATIGDMPTDVAMFAAGGFSIAMGNASAEVKARADAVAGPNDDEGFARALRRFVLPLAPSPPSPSSSPGVSPGDP